MSVRLFVGNLAYDVSDTELIEFLSPVGKPLSVRILTDRETGRPRGCGFVEFGEASQAEEAIRRFHQQLFKGRPLVINEARPREAGPPPRDRAPMRGPVDAGSAPIPAGADRPARPTRTFGADAPPRGSRKRNARGPSTERRPKRPIPVRGGGQFFSAGVDDTADDADDVAFWARAKGDDEE